MRAPATGPARVAASLALACATLTAACDRGGVERPPSASDPPHPARAEIRDAGAAPVEVRPGDAAIGAAAALVPPSSASAVVRGRVVLTGAPPPMREQDRSTDPFCARDRVREETVVAGPGGGLRDVLVRVVGGLPAGAPLPPAPAEPHVVTQERCMFRPRMSWARVGQKVLVRNEDQTLHNVHAYRGGETVYNVGQPPGSPGINRTLGDDGSLIRLKCDVHPWMSAFVLVSRHPFVAVTGGDGSFELRGLPPGAYKLQLFHERYGVKNVEVRVPPDGAPPSPANLRIEYTGREPKPDLRAVRPGGR